MRRGIGLRPTVGTTWPPDVREAVRFRDRSCIGPRIGMPYVCLGEVAVDHVRAAHGMGMKSESTERNGALLCFVHHRVKTENGREWRPRILDWIAAHRG